jgi:hypothetical protein
MAAPISTFVCTGEGSVLPTLRCGGIGRLAHEHPVCVTVAGLFVGHLFGVK